MIFVLTAINKYTKHVDRFINSLNKQNYKNIHLIVVLDGCAAKKITTHNYPYTLIYGDGKLFWGGSMAKGISKILEFADDQDYILTINIDCEFGPTFLTSLLSEIIKNRNRSIIGTACVDYKGKLIDAGWTVNWRNGSISGTSFSDLSSLLKNSNTIDYSFLSSKGTLIPVSVIKKIGNYHRQHFPHYASDFEFSNRAKRLGYKLTISKKTWLINDHTNTGISGVLTSDITLKQLFTLLFSIKSQINIKDHFFLIFHCCPLIYQPLNYLYLIGKIAYLTSYLKPFYPLRPLLVKIRSRLLYVS